LNLPDNSSPKHWYLEKLKKRSLTLMIPYLFWNLFLVAAILVKTGLFSKIGIPQVDVNGELFTVRSGPLYWLLTGPANFPLWFMRDLMVMSLLTPVLWMVFSHAPRYISISLLILLYTLPFNTPILTWRGYFFFCFGAYMGVRKLNLLDLCQSIKRTAYIAAVVLLVLASYWNNTSIHEWLLRAFYPFGMISFMNFCDTLTQNKQTEKWLTALASPVFFIYAAHEIYILGWTKGLFVRLFGEGLLGTWIRFFFVPLAVLGICLALYHLLKKLVPGVLAFVCGGRTESRN